MHLTCRLDKAFCLDAHDAALKITSRFNSSITPVGEAMQTAINGSALRFALNLKKSWRACTTVVTTIAPKIWPLNLPSDFGILTCSAVAEAYLALVLETLSQVGASVPPRSSLTGMPGLGMPPGSQALTAWGQVSSSS